MGHAWINVVYEVSGHLVIVLGAGALPMAERREHLQHVHHARLPHRLEQHDALFEWLAACLCTRGDGRQCKWKHKLG